MRTIIFIICVFIGMSVQAQEKVVSVSKTTDLDVYQFMENSDPVRNATTKGVVMEPGLYVVAQVIRNDQGRIEWVVVLDEDGKDYDLYYKDLTFNEKKGKLVVYR